MELGFLEGGGVCGALVRSIDWSKTPLGPISRWPQSLRTIVGVVLHSRQPMLVFWGRELIQLYNDPCLPSFGAAKHPHAMGQPGPECWSEAWSILGPQVEAVMERGTPSWHEDALVPVARNGRIEEVYASYGYSPIFVESGAIGGTLVVYTETTARVIGARRAQVLRDLAERGTLAGEAASFEREMIRVLRDDREDIPVALLCTRVQGGDTDVMGATGVDDALVAEVPSPLEEPTTLGEPPHGFVVPLRGARPGTDDFIVFGLSKRLPFDESYRALLTQIGVIAGQVRARLEALRLRTEAERDKRNLLQQAPVPTALVTGPDHVYELANDPYLEMVGRDVLGKRFVDAFPEGGELLEILDRVYNTGKRHYADEHLMPLDRGDGTLEDRYFRFILEPLRDAKGAVYGMMLVAVDVTTQVSARQVLESAARAKDEFFALLGHELRNPLAPILTALQLMKLKGDDGSLRERQIIERQAQHLVRLVDDLLDVSRVASGKVALSRQRLALADVVASAIETATPLIEERRHTLVVDVPRDGLDVDGDPVRLVQVFANLLTNAAKYTDAGGRITVLGSREGKHVVLRVVDNGSGIAGDLLPYVFESFFQGPRASDRSQGGLGLGLALVQNLVSMHGGTVGAASEGAGCGSTFAVRLPAAEGDAPAREQSSTLPPPAPVTPHARRVLLVEDNPDIAETFGMLLTTMGFVVEVAHDGPAALRLLREFRPDVAVLDIGLPVMDGYELAVQIRATLGEHAPRLIAMTGYGQAEDRARSEKAGFALHLVKPVDADIFVAALEKS